MFTGIKYATFFTILTIITACSSNSSVSSKILKRETVTNNKDSHEINISTYKAYFVNEIANIRAKGAKCGGPTTALTPNPNLEAAAKAHAKDMAINHFVQHDGSGTITDPARKSNGIGSTFIDRVIYFGYPAKTHDLVGETITHTKNSVLKTDDVRKHFRSALKLILNDPPHCKILMNPRFKDVGIGVYKTKDGYYWAIEYGEIER